MTSWAQPYEDTGSRIVIPHVTTVDSTWERDAATTHFEGRVYPVTARTDHVTEEWTAQAVWGSQQRPQAAEYLALLRDTAVSVDSRLEIHLEPMNGAWVDVVVQAVDVPQQLGIGRTDVTVTFRRVE